MQGKTVEVEALEGRPPKTIDVPDEKGGACRYCLAQWTQEGMTAAYTFLLRRLEGSGKNDWRNSFVLSPRSE